jgi:hypothetical protein
MVVDERARHELYLQLERVLGTEAAVTLLEQLPPVGWADVATKHDLAELERRMDLRFDQTKHEIMSAFRAELNAALVSQTRTMLFTMAGTVVSLVGLGLAAARLG